MDPLPPKISLSFFSFKTEFQANAKSVGAARRGGWRRFWRGSGFRSFADLPRQFARNWRECWRRSWRSAPGRRPVRLLHASGAAAQKPPPPNPRLLCIATQLGGETGGGCGCQRLRIQGIVEFIGSYILSTYFALNFGLGWAAALCSSGRR